MAKKKAVKTKAAKSAKPEKAQKPTKAPPPAKKARSKPAPKPRKQPGKVRLVGVGERITKKEYLATIDSLRDDVSNLRQCLGTGDDEIETEKWLVPAIQRTDKALRLLNRVPELERRSRPRPDALLHKQATVRKLASVFTRTIDALIAAGKEAVGLKANAEFFSAANDKLSEAWAYLDEIFTPLPVAPTKGDGDGDGEDGDGGGEPEATAEGAAGDPEASEQPGPESEYPVASVNVGDGNGPSEHVSVDLNAGVPSGESA